VQVQELQDWQGEGRAFVVRTTTMEADSVDAALLEAGCLPAQEQEGGEGLAYIKQIGPRVGAELRSKAISAILLSWAAIIIYIWYRFQFKWGLAAVIALVHDTLITLGFIALARIEISLTIIAALLTIIGFSINDTIVVFDRIRENRRLRKGKTFEETVDISINETLSRTIITSLTVLFSALCLFLLGVGEISAFALTICVGIITGTYSSIFVASAVLVDWKGRKRKA
jgi:preprotein translocase SecF subunit